MLPLSTAVITAVYGVDGAGVGDIAGVTYDVDINHPGQSPQTVAGVRPLYRPAADGVLIKAFPVGMPLVVLRYGMNDSHIIWPVELPPIENCP